MASIEDKAVEKIHNKVKQLKECIQNQRELEVLDSWMKLALQAESVQGFEEQIETVKALV